MINYSNIAKISAAHQQSFDGTIADFTRKDRAKRYRYAVSAR
ncbi:hypothetical protein [Pelosinus baikalensis]|nr:hypothetical protein [Pelosinus baikalensis]